MIKSIVLSIILTLLFPTISTAQIIKNSELFDYKSNDIFIHGNLLMDTNSIFFSCTESKGFSHIYSGKWSFNEIDSTIKLVAYNNLDLIKNITQKRIFPSSFKLRITDYFNKELHLPCNISVTLIKKNGTKEVLDLEYDGFSKITLNPLKVSAVQVDLGVGMLTASEQIEVKHGRQITIQLGIPSSMFSYRCASGFDEVFIEKYRLKNGKLYDVKTGEVVYD